MILNLGNDFFTVLRVSTDSLQVVLAIHNVTEQNQTVRIDTSLLPEALPQDWLDLISGNMYSISNNELILNFQPYQFTWLENIS